MGAKEKARKSVIDDRRRKVSALMLAGASFREIAAELGVAHGTVATDARAIMRDWRHTTVNNVIDARLQELQRLDRLTVSVWRSAMRGDIDAVEKAVKISERRAKMLGLDMPQQQEVVIRLEAPRLVQMFADAVAGWADAEGIPASKIDRLWDRLSAMRSAVIESERDAPALPGVAELIGDETVTNTEYQEV